MLQDLCPRCGAEVSDGSRACGECGFGPAAPDALADRPGVPGITLGPTALALLALGTVAMVLVAFVAGMRVQSSSAPAEAIESPTATPSQASAAVPVRGRVRFAERLGDGLELESYRTQFTRDHTIAWRAEFVEPPPTDELTLVITWVSIRERMQLSESAVAVTDPELPMIARDEVSLRDLVPTAGLYEVAYLAGDVTLAVGVFELLPPDR